MRRSSSNCLLGACHRHMSRCNRSAAHSRKCFSPHTAILECPAFESFDFCILCCLAETDTVFHSLHFLCIPVLVALDCSLRSKKQIRQTCLSKIRISIRIEMTYRSFLRRWTPESPYIGSWEIGSMSGWTIGPGQSAARPEKLTVCLPLVLKSFTWTISLEIT